MANKSKKMQHRGNISMDRIDFSSPMKMLDDFMHKTHADERRLIFIKSEPGSVSCFSHLIFTIKKKAAHPCGLQRCEQKLLCDVHPLLNLSLLAAKLTQIVQFRSSDFTMSYNFYLLYIRRIQRPCLLDTDAAGLLSYSEGRANAAALNL